jgi:predicted acyltransferase
MARPARLLSLDLVRGADVWLMLFVNEMAGVRGTPAFLRHVPASADGMTITDVVFPAFLFVTGMAVPLALGGRLERGEPARRVWRHVLVRVAALLVIGVFMVNDEHASEAGVVPRPVWTLLMTVGVALVWMASERPASARARRTLVVAGVVLLAALALVYRADGGSGLVQMRPRWWGILGLIGWAYLLAAAAYLFARDRPGPLGGLVALLYLVALADEADALGALLAVRPFVHVGRALAAHGALALSGTVLTLALLAHRRRGERAARFVPWALAGAAALGAAGWLLHALHDVHPAFWINKTRATVPWCLLSAAGTVAAWTVAYVVADVRDRRRWPRLLTGAGENALTIYLLAPFLHAAFAAIALAFGTNPYHALGGSLPAGLLRAVAFSWAVVALAQWLRGRGLRLRL